MWKHYTKKLVHANYVEIYLSGMLLPWDEHGDGYFSEAEMVAFKRFYGQNLIVIIFLITINDKMIVYVDIVSQCFFLSILGPGNT